MKKALIVPVIVVATPIAVLADGIFLPSYKEEISFLNTPGANMIAMGMAFDGDHYWSCDGGGFKGIRLSEYDSDGTWLADYEPGFDPRSIFTADNTSPVYVRPYPTNTILVQTTAGVFADHVTLTGENLDPQSSVVFHTDGSGSFIAMEGGTVDTWNPDGSHAGSTALVDFGSMFGEGDYPANRGIASAAGYYLTYSSGFLSAWDAGGVRVGTTELIAGGTSPSSHFSFSYANDMVFVVDDLQVSWHGYFIPFCEGDVNGDGIVDPLDSGFVLARFGCEFPGDGLNCLAADANGDGIVDPLDSGFVLARFGPCP
ncbi:MAG: hypothetical protein IID37_09390 [Planctomycetes bacterium]|nr:hypothetical protein [Planctomycetota bacterium]